MKKSKLSTIILIVIFIVGLSLLLYPTISDYWNSFRQSKAISEYVDIVSHLDAEKNSNYMEQAREFNKSILKRKNTYILTDEQKEEYLSCLNLSTDGIIGYIEIPSIACSLPIYHGTSDSVLQVGIGHIEWSSLPVGGSSTHSVLSGHRGLPSAKLFTNLDKVRVGDIFMLRILDEVITYEVDNIAIVEPDETDLLSIEEGEDYCTLVTCTPYGVNSHRLLVRGHRIENASESKTVRVTADAAQISPMIVAPVVAIPIILLFMILLLLDDKTKRHGGRKDEN